MHEKRSKIDFFVNFRKLQKKLPICKKKYAKILNSVRAVVTDVEKKVKRRGRNFFGSHLDQQSVIFKASINVADLRRAKCQKFLTDHRFLVYDTTVLGRKKRVLKTPHKSTSLPPIPKIFFLETFYISPKLRKKF